MTDTTMDLLTVAEAAVELRLSRQTAYRLIAADKLPAHRIGGSLRINASELRALLESPTKSERNGIVE